MLVSFISIQILQSLYFHDNIESGFGWLLIKHMTMYGFNDQDTVTNDLA